MWFLLPESPRWLLSKGRTEEARALMTRIAERNGHKVDLSRHHGRAELKEERSLESIIFLSRGNFLSPPELGFADLFRTRDILVITVVMFFCWPIITMGYFGLGLSMTQLGGNIFVSFILGALVEVRNSANFLFII